MSDPFVPPPTPPSERPVPPPSAFAGAPPPVTPPLPVTPPPVGAPPPVSPVETTGLQPNVAAAIAAFFLLVGGIIFLLLEKKNQYVRFYAMQSVFLGAFAVAFSVGLGIVLLILHGVPLIGSILGFASIVVRLGILVAWVVLIVRAYSGREWEIPYLGALARQQLGPKAPTI